jgi:hypothetical protein
VLPGRDHVFALHEPARAARHAHRHVLGRVGAVVGLRRGGPSRVPASNSSTIAHESSSEPAPSGVSRSFATRYPKWSRCHAGTALNTSVPSQLWPSSCWSYPSPVYECTFRCDWAIVYNIATDRDRSQA